MRNLCLKSFIFMTSVVAIMLFSSTGMAATHRVEQDGSGEFTEIQAAVDVSAPGDTILIGPGAYSSTHTAVMSLGHEPDVCVHVNVEGLTLRGTSRDEVILGPDSYYFGNFGSVIFGIIDSGQGLTSPWKVENITFRDFWHGVYATGEVEISNCRFVGFQGSAIAEFETGGSLISGCEFLNNEMGVGSKHRDYVHISDCYFEYSGNYFHSVADLLIENCTGVRGGGSTHGGTVGLIRNVQLTNSGFGFMGGSDIVVRNSSFDSSPYSDAIDAVEASRVLLDSCIVSGVGGTVAAGENAQLTIHNSHILSESGPAVMCLRYSGPDYFLDLTGNYWGTNDPTEIPSLIHDGYDDSSVHAFVKYAPIAEGPVSVEKSSWGDLKAMFR